jgi:predicted alternative tryptophan synthase beta-subunit
MIIIGVAGGESAFGGTTYPLARRNALSHFSVPSNSFQIQTLLVEVNGFEPMTSCVQGRRSPS